MTQLAINFDDAPGFAQCRSGAVVDAAVLGVLSDGPLRSLKIIIALWHEYSWDEVESSIERLLAAGEIALIGTTHPPQGWNPMNGEPITDQIYGITGGAA